MTKIRFAILFLSISLLFSLRALSQNCFATGTILREYWTNVAGTSLSSVPFTSSPTSTMSLNSFEGPKSAGDNYGSRIRGYICAPATGNYTFWIASDNQSELWLSTDTLPENKIKRAFVNSYTNSREWTKYSSQQSEPVALKAGKNYYIEAIHREGSQGDHLAVGWQLPSGTLERPIPGIRLSTLASSNSTTTAPEFTPNVFAVIADYGLSGANELAVSNLVKSWKPEYIITGGDNNYWRGSDTTIDENIGKYYHDYIYPYTGAFGNGAEVNRFWPSMGNHDWMTSSAQPYLAYFTLPGNERYYDFVKGDVHFFVLNSDPAEPDGITSNSIQGNWLKNQLAASAAKWKVVYFHHSPYCSDQVHGSSTYTRWPFKAWGADVVVTGHSHVYERVIIDGFPYIINGLGGHSKYSFYSSPVAESQIRYNANYGALQVKVKPDTLLFRFYSISGDLIDSYPVLKSVGGSTTACKSTILPGGPTTFCAGGSVVLNGPPGSGIFYQWKKNGSNILGANAQTYTATDAGDYQLKISFTGCANWSAPLKVTVNTSLTAKITAGGPTTFCNGNAVVLYANTCSGYNYQWKKNDVSIQEATSSSYTASSSGIYQVKIVQGSAVAWSAKVTVSVTACEGGAAREIAPDTIVAENEDLKINLYPNPTTGGFSFQLCFEELEEGNLAFRVLNSAGQEVFIRPPHKVSGCVKESIELEHTLAAGIYIFQVEHNNKTESVKLFLNR